MQQSQMYKNIFSPPPKKKNILFKPRPTSQLPSPPQKKLEFVGFLHRNQAASIAFCWSIDPWRTLQIPKKNPNLMAIL